MKRYLLVAGLAAACACSPRVLTVRTMAPLLDTGADALYEEPDPQLGREALGSQLKLLEVLLKNDPGNPTLRLLCAQGFGGYAFMFLEDSEPARARDFYLRGRAHALVLLDRKPALRGLDKISTGELESALKSAAPADAPALFWAAYGWGGWINLSKDDPDAVAGLPKIASIMRRVQELRPGYYFGGPDIFLGVYYAARPKMFGGDPDKSKERFEAALKASEGRFLTTKVLYARYYAVAAQDQALFKALNEEVASSTLDYPPARLANAVARLKAKRLLEKINDLF